MEYVALYRKYRPKDFDELVGQDHVVRALRNSIINERIAHAYLFCGTRGTGKTSCAKIYARAVNCLEPRNGSPCNLCKICKGILSENILDVVEIDAASNNSVDNIRELREDVVYTPSQARYKVYIIDEVHMLSKGAFNALLKTLEEPPSHVIFILATTEPQKLPATILSRCQRFDFGRIPVETIKLALKEICEKSNVKIEDEALTVISRVADGALRDAISILDQCVALSEGVIKYKEVINIIGISKHTEKNKLVYSIMNKQIDEVLNIIDEIDKKGINFKYFIEEFIEYLRNILICILSNNPKEIIIAEEEDFEDMKNLSNKMGKESVLKMIKHLSKLSADIKWSQSPRVLIEVGLMDLAKKEVKKYDVDIEKRLSHLEQTILKGNIKIVDQNIEEKKKKIKQQKEMVEKKEKVRINTKVKEEKEQRTVTDEDKLWKKVLDYLDKEKKMMLKIYLQNADLKKIGQRYALIFKDEAKSQLKSMEKEENMSQIKEIISKIIGNNDIVISCELENEFLKHENETYENIENKLKNAFEKEDVELEILD